MQQTILLRDYVDVRRLYQLEVATGQFAIIDKPTGRGFEDCPWGYGQVRRLGVLARHFSTPSRIRRFIYSWHATKAGRATGTHEFQREMDERAGRYDA
jgi:hypothetical protein